jgi:hypothetical protein
MGLTRIAAGLWFGVLTACQSLIDLGEEPELVLPASVPEECGVRRAGGPACAECLNSKCCDEQLACGADPVCKDLTENCFTTCFDGACYEACLAQGDAVLGDLFFCAADCATQCTPVGDCGALADCCGRLAGTPVEEGCYRNARSENQELCRTSLESLAPCSGAGGAPDQ